VLAHLQNYNRECSGIMPQKLVRIYLNCFYFNPKKRISQEVPKFFRFGDSYSVFCWANLFIVPLNRVAGVSKLFFNEKRAARQVVSYVSPLMLLMMVGGSGVQFLQEASRHLLQRLLTWFII